MTRAVSATIGELGMSALVLMFRFPLNFYSTGDGSTGQRGWREAWPDSVHAAGWQTGAWDGTRQGRYEQTHEMMLRGTSAVTRSRLQMRAAWTDLYDDALYQVQCVGTASRVT
eukprot:766259-Hanusia_phi.AAC.1